MHLLTTLHILLGAATTIGAVPASLWSPSSRPFNPTPRQQSQIQARSVLSSKASLQQYETNGNSLLGTANAPHFKQYKGQQTWGLSTNIPWGTKTVANTNVYHDSPDTGVIQQYEWTIERGYLAPDGVNRSMILVNGGFPGPTIEANWGDTISVTVHNKITGPEEGTSVHWHGFLQKGTPWMDGVPGVTQCPIAPGQSFTYTFKAELYGTSWWHAHYSAQYSSGLYGAIIIHGPDQDGVSYDSDLGPVMIADYYHKDYFSLVQSVMGTDFSQILVKSDNNLINGKGIINCNTTTASTQPGTNLTDPLACTPNAGFSKFYFTSGQTHKLRLINAGSEGLQKFSIDGHELIVIAYDFVPIQPYTTNVVTLGVGQRADVLVKANQNSNGAFWMRSTMSKSCSLMNQPSALAIVYYENANQNFVPTTQATIDNTTPCTNDDLTTAVPYYPIAPPSIPDRTVSVDVNYTTNATGHYVWTMNNSTFRTNYNKPILHDFSYGNESFPEEWNVYNFGNSSSIRIIINNLSKVPHPMHIHGHNMFVLSSTNTITANPTIVNPSNPTRRDTQILPPNGQIVLQIEADNPGVWPLHCHIAWHVSSGLYMNILSQPDLIPSLGFPQASTDVCAGWNAFTSSAVPDQIDSGLRLMQRPRKALLA